VIALKRPDDEALRRFLEPQRDAALSYADVGATASELPAGYDIDRNRVRVGAGVRDFHRAVQALLSWRMFDLGWVAAIPREPTIREGAPVAVVAHAYGLWFVNACRVVYTVDEKHNGVHRTGFAYGTLPEHVESGEERFLIELDAAGAVWYDILAFSKARHPLARLGYPLTRALQQRFARDSMNRMVHAIEALEAVRPSSI
jgi:uncharacterized protein (UPF0548 family)